jgi:acetoacetyl-CoA synthetase
MILFVLHQQNQVIDDAMRECINARISTKASAHHVPDEVMQIAEVSRNMKKKWDVPIRKLPLWSDLVMVVDPDSMANPLKRSASFPIGVSFAIR